ncbi:MAG: YegP family protein, partial [Bacilli bacterium]|nr:YegP family protein [Bacilli bacterium]
KTVAKKAIDNIREKLLDGSNITIAKDKQDRYQFRLYSDNGILLLMGETYPKRDSAESAARSARNFIKDAKIVE